ncbi:MAG: hypothetical protein SFU87_09020 [Chitinophagaceae bacterium]|nr:hypothetical protein [Chitinophagaceae bacterium]
MKQSRFTAMLFCAAMGFFLISCGGGEEKAATETTATDSAATVAPPPVNTIITTAQNMMIVIHKVADFAKWKPVYEAHDSVRLANGLHSYVIGRGVQDSNMVLVAVKVDDLAKAKAFSKDASLKQAMQKSGVKGAPKIMIVTATWQDTAVLTSVPRSITTFSIKDWDGWIKSFEEGKQERTDNGIAARVVGHDADDNKKVALVTALLDTAKAFAYYKSDALKKRREAGGVTSEPERFLFNIVARY